MPNYVTSRCAVHGPHWEIERFKRIMIRPAPAGHSDEGALLFDFNAIIPMPACVAATESGTTADEGVALIRARGEKFPPDPEKLGLHAAQWTRIVRAAGLPADSNVRQVAAEYLRTRPDVEAAGRAQLTCLLETGFTDWYGWCNANWGTKWSSFRYEEIEGESTFTFRYETAWSFPFPIFEKLSEEFPLLSFECATYDEGDNFAGAGWFNPPPGQPQFEVGYKFVGPDLYQLVYGRPQPVYDEEGNEVD